MPEPLFPEDRSALPFTVDAARASTLADVESERKAIHEAVEIKYFVEGTSTLIVGSRTVPVRKGDVVVINPYEFHATVDTGADTGKYHLLMVPLDFLEGLGIDGLALRGPLLAERRSFPTLFRDDRALGGVMERIAEEYTARAPGHAVVLQGLVVELFGLLLRAGLTGGAPETASGTLRSYRAVEPALRYIRDHYAEPVSVDGLAGLCRISKPYFCRVFRAVTGKTATEYLRDYRLNVADTLLGNTDLSVAQTAARCGFSDENYFCRRYRKTFGLSPGKRRRGPGAGPAPDGSGGQRGRSL